MTATRAAASTPAGRQATENVLLDALETVLLRDGLRNLSVNAVVDEAGVGKPLLYRYFGDLPGLVRAWSQRRGYWARISGDGQLASSRATDDETFRHQIVAELVASAEYLRSHPVTLEFLAEELTAASDLSAAFTAARDEHRRPFLKAMLSDPRYLRREHHRVIVILHAALVYLAMRARRAPNFMGLRLDTEAGWRDALEMVRELAEPSGKSATAGRSKTRSCQQRKRSMSP